MHYNDWLCDVPANSLSELAWSEFAVSKPRWHRRIAIVGGSFFVQVNYQFRLFISLSIRLINEVISFSAFEYPLIMTFSKAQL